MVRRVMVALALLSIVVAGCGGASTPGAASATEGERKRSLFAEEFRFRAAIFHAAAPRADAASALRKLAQAVGFALAGSPDGDASGRTRVRLFQPPIAEFAPPAADSLEHFGRGLRAEDERAVPASRAVTVLEFVGAASSANEDYAKALAIVQTLARELGGYVWDEEARNVFTLESFGSRAGAFANGVPNVMEHVSLHLYRDGELMRIVSLGMIKFGLPDVAVEEVPGSSANSMASLVNLICQTLVERPELEASGVLRLSLDGVRNPEARRDFKRDLSDGATGKLEVTLVSVPPEEGDADNRLLELVFPGDERERQQRQVAALSTLFGSNDAIARIEHDQRLLAASERAKKKAFALRERFVKGPPPREMLLVKAPFATPGGSREWMWVEVVTWKEDVIHGILDNDPVDVPTLKAGARVDVRAGDIFDYLWTKGDGTVEGNETSAIIEAMESDR